MSLSPPYNRYYNRYNDNSDLKRKTCEIMYGGYRSNRGPCPDNRQCMSRHRHPNAGHLNRSQERGTPADRRKANYTGDRRLRQPGQTREQEVPLCQKLPSRRPNPLQLGLPPLHKGASKITRRCGPPNVPRRTEGPIHPVIQHRCNTIITEHHMQRGNLMLWLPRTG
jgi:hypothetical protein